MYKLYQEVTFVFAIKHLQIGDRVTVLHHVRSYSSVVQDMPEPDKVVIAQPTNMGIYLNLENDEEAELFFKKENGILMFRFVQEARYAAKGVPLLRLRAVSEVRRSQRRRLFRLEKSLSVQLCVKQEDKPESAELTINARTLNISGSGCRIALRQPVSNGARLVCGITLSPGTVLTLEGRVVWVEKLSGSERMYIIGVQFVDEDSETQQKLVSYITNEQRRQLKNK
jgi:c-di-GMP-binding flagellar brake protein YcgR